MRQLAAIKAFSHQHPLLFLPLAALLWLGLYLLILPGSELLVSWLPVPRQSQLGSALQFFLYDTPKVLLLLTGIVFVMGMINSWFTPERTRALLAGRGEGGANVLAALLGIVTPFCSCSAVPLFIGFVQAGVPLGVLLLSHLGPHGERGGADPALWPVWLEGSAALSGAGVGCGHGGGLDHRSP